MNKYKPNICLKYQADAKSCRWAPQLWLGSKTFEFDLKGTVLPAMQQPTRLSFRILLHPGAEAISVSDSQLSAKLELFWHHFL